MIAGWVLALFCALKDEKLINLQQTVCSFYENIIYLHCLNT